MALPPPDPRYVLRGANDAVNTLCFHCADPDLPLLFSGSSNGLIHIWNMKTRRIDRTMDGHGGTPVYWVKTLHSRNSLLRLRTGCGRRCGCLYCLPKACRDLGSKDVQIADRREQRCRKRQEGGSPAPRGYADFQGRDQNICLWDLAEGRTAVTDSVCTESVGFCKCSLLEMAEGRWLLALPWKGLEEVQVLELPSKNSVCTLKPEADAKLGMPMCLKLWQPNAGSHPFLLAGYENGSVALWNLSMGKTLSRLACHQEPIMCLDFDAEKGKGVSGSSEKTLCIWSHNEQQNLKLQDTISLTNPGIADVALRQDRKILATAGWDYRIRLFGWKKLKPLAVLDYHMATVHCVAFSDHTQPSERLMAAASKDHRISVWSIYNQT